VDWAAKMLELDELLQRKPSALSGGQRQRVAMGRAIVRKPTVFCMDEPLSNLDAKLRVTMRGEIAALQRNLGVTTVYVTHDQVEAMTMGHRVAVMRDGQLQQIDTPQELYSNPVNTFVASFIGSPAITLFTCPVVEEGVAAMGSLRIPLPRNVKGAISDSVIVGIRPESWTAAGPDEPALTLTTDMVEMLGSQAFLYGTIAEPDAVASAQSQTLGLTHEPHRIAVMLDRRNHPTAGDLVRIKPAADEIYLFDPLTQQVIV
ncbi:MAG: ATP-binding cassette domain-containing protein, partial [Actinomycetaceae bacterium]|nr:ATP-binding cassette domain-containing protein [Actinomycetaceae bacterium]